jgi:outer membrane protein OmpA-like peptidoglycan-associated protein
MKTFVFLILVFVSTLFSNLSRAQIFGKKLISISDCAGSVNIIESGTYALQFIGGQGVDLKTFSTYTKDTLSKNLIWAYYETEGQGTISLSIKQNAMSLFCFETNKEDPCTEVIQGGATKLIYKSLGDTSSNWTFNVKDKKIYLFAFSAKEKSTETLSFDFTYILRDNNGVEIKDQKTVDLREKEAPFYTYIKVQNIRTKKPVIVNLAISGSKDVDGFYQGSDIFLTLKKGNKSLIISDIKGYFSKDVEYKFNPAKIDTILIELEPLTIGAVAQFEEIEFQRGTSTILKGSEKKLKRLVDFMALNANVSIEIQGHVNDKSKKNKNSSVRLSRKRAKRVMRFLVHNGIHPSRMTAVGYGNSKPIYPNPKKAFEEQANRRVEIVVKQ